MKAHFLGTRVLETFSGKVWPAGPSSGHLTASQLWCKELERPPFSFYTKSCVLEWMSKPYPTYTERVGF